MPTYMYRCESCGNITDMVFDSYEGRKNRIKCEVCGKWARYSFADTACSSTIKSGDHWAVSGGFAGKGEGSISRSIPSEMLTEQMEHERKSGVSQHVEWVVDKKKPAFVRPKFNSLQGRRKWDRAHGFHDKDSFLD